MSEYTEADLDNLRDQYLAKLDRQDEEIARLQLAVRDQAGVELSEENDRLIALNSWLEADKAAILWTISGYVHKIERLEADNKRCHEDKAAISGTASDYLHLIEEAVAMLDIYYEPNSDGSTPTITRCRQVLGEQERRP